MARELVLVDARRRPLGEVALRLRADGVEVAVVTDVDGRFEAPEVLPLVVVAGDAEVVLTVAPPDAEVVLLAPAEVPRGVVAAFLVALAVRLTFLWVFEPSPLVADEKWYHASALRLLDRGLGWLVDWSQNVPVTAPPVVPSVYALIIGAAGDVERWVRVGNVFAGALLVVPTYMIGRRLAGRAAGVAAAALVAVHPDLVAYSTRLWTEPLYLLIAMGAVAGLLDAPARRPWARWIPLGALFGLAALTRESGLALPGVAVVWAIAEGLPGLKRRLPALAGVLLGAVLVIAPWTSRLRADPRPDGLVARTSAFNLYLGNVGNKVPYAELADNEGERAALATSLAKEAILADMPLWPLHKIQRTLPHFLGQRTLSTQVWSTDPKNPLSSKTRLSALEDPTNRRNLAVAAALLQVVALVMGAVGWTLAIRRRSWTVALVLLAVVGVTYAPAWLTFAKARFSLPAVPAFLVGAAVLLTRGPEAWRGAGWGQRAAAIAAGLWIGWVGTSDWP